MIHPVSTGAFGLTMILAIASGCASTPPASSTTSATTARQHSSAPTERCKVTRFDDGDFSVVAVEVMDLGAYAAILPGDDWQVDCTIEGNRFVAAQSAASGRVATITLDDGVKGAFSLEEYARQQIAWIQQGMAKQPDVTIEAGEPQIVAEGLYGFGIRATVAGRLMLQVNAHKVLPTKHGLLRFHLSETGDSPAEANEHAGVLLRAAGAFGTPPNG